MLNHSTINHSLVQTSTSTIDRMLREEHCHRCGGLMIQDYCLDVGSDNAEVEVTVKRCCTCGELIDPTILRNRMKVSNNGSHESIPAHQGISESRKSTIQGTFTQDVLQSWYAAMRQDERQESPQVTNQPLT